METAIQLEASGLIENSRRLTGITSPIDPDFLEGLEILVRDLRDNGRLNMIGLQAQEAGLTNMLCNRLRLDALFGQHPEIADEIIHSPVIIIGMPRSGTTKMQRMLAASGQFQYLPLWQILNPAPIEQAPPGQDDPRIALAEQAMAAMKAAFPEFYAGHPMDAREADEEVFMADLVMRGWNPCYSANVPVYEAWLERQDFGVWYDYLKKLLQLFQWQNQSSQPWLLKTCEHLPYLDHLFRVFPDATVVHCHRDPVTTIASLGALTAASWRMNSDQVDPKSAAHFVFAHMTKQVAGYMALRPELEDHFRFVDVGYPNIVGDIQGAIGRIYHTAGLSLSPQAIHLMSQWEQDNPPGKHGSHNYSLPELGLSASAIREAVGPYIKRFSTCM